MSNNSMSAQHTPHEHKCFACDRRLVRPEEVYTADGNGSNMVWVGPECFKLIRCAGDAGYQPPLGGPRLYLFNPNGRK